MHLHAYVSPQRACYLTYDLRLSNSALLALLGDLDPARVRAEAHLDRQRGALPPRPRAGAAPRGRLGRLLALKARRSEVEQINRGPDRVVIFLETQKIIEL